MYYIQFISSLLLLYVSFGVITAWYRGMVSKQRFTSVPFFGGVTGMIGLYINPIYDLGYWVILPLFIDYFSIPFLVSSIIRRITDRKN